MLLAELLKQLEASLQNDANRESQGLREVRYGSLADVRSRMPVCPLYALRADMLSVGINVC